MRDKKAVKAGRPAFFSDPKLIDSRYHRSVDDGALGVNGARQGAGELTC